MLSVCPGQSLIANFINVYFLPQENANCDQLLHRKLGLVRRGPGPLLHPLPVQGSLDAEVGPARVHVSVLSVHANTLGMGHWQIDN